MSRKKNNEKNLRASLKKTIRKEMRAIYMKKNSIDKKEVISKFVSLHPELEDTIQGVVHRYAKTINDKAASGTAQWGKNGGSTSTTLQSVEAGVPKARPPRQAKEKAMSAIKVEVMAFESEQDEGSSHSEQSNTNFAEKLLLDKTPPKQPGVKQQLSKRVVKNAKDEAAVGMEEPDLVHKTNALLESFKEDLASQNRKSSLGVGSSINRERAPDLETQLQFLSLDGQNTSGFNGSSPHSVEHAVLVSPSLEEVGQKLPAQFGLLGHLDTRQSEDLVDPRVMLNTNIPFSAFICGLQGSGKSHTTSCMIENCSLPFKALGTLQKPLSTLVLHYNEYSSNVSNQPSEAAFLASIMPEYRKHFNKSIPVRVLTSPSNFYNLEKMYSQIPNVRVRPFRLKPYHLNIATMLSLMSMGKKDSMPLYMAQITRVLREMALSNKGSFNYFDFRNRVRDLRLDRTQTPFLDQRFDLLDSFLELKKDDHTTGGDYFMDGGVTILDLSCPFMDQGTACILFRIAIDLFLHAHPSRGKMIVADEAHKYMDSTEAANALTETFLNIIRQQRHLGTRIIISTQEPTISPRLIDLCSITIVHRFSSPEWFQSIKKHIAIADKEDTNSNEENVNGLYQISSLRTGEALVFAPSAYLLDGHQEVMDVKHKSFKMVIRKRITWDGGQTITSVR
ncbi:hypothetical protein BGW36DRAFT_358229 [Talaromyces proteolyticus]|uniref:Zona occludens toxin N-terminal domain-containing protein n=1 Tax=Talaromyces proteolyticus TaxID=1131652 RepID=A0AAD4KWX7_9EURO|nr:uncharacterized protein BGW36DRAFT_358229 [Talaromyces proteolyticus]KAH8698707.1 hypothetical protein BGW36DRAFT_358229 [Talaromyces proteolyticus]